MHRELECYCKEYIDTIFPIRLARITNICGKKHELLQLTTRIQNELEKRNISFFKILIRKNYNKETVKQKFYLLEKIKKFV